MRNHLADNPEAPGLAAIRMSPALLWTMALASAVAIANIYYNQPMLVDMMRTFGVGPHEIGLVATFTQVGYAFGMFLFIPLGDYVERRRLVVLLFMAVAVSLAAAALAQNLVWIVVASFFIGATTVIPQIMIPLATELAEPGERGRTVGIMLSGVLLGILLARTVSGIVAAHFGWRMMFWAASVFAVIFAGLLRTELPFVPAQPNLTYRQVLSSLVELAIKLPKLIKIGVMASMFFAAFMAFWTTLAFLLETPPYHYGSQAAGLFGLVGATGVLVAPVAGRLSDRRTPRLVVGIAIGVLLAAYAAFWFFGFNLWGLVLGVILLDAAVQGAQVANQSRVLGLLPEARNRVNTIYMILYFSGGSMGSLLGSWSWNHWHWHGVCLMGFIFTLSAAAAFVFPVPNTLDPVVVRKFRNIAGESEGAAT